MLKPKKDISKKEIQRDPFLETVDKVQYHLEQNRKSYTNLGLFLIVILIGYNVFSNRNSQNSLKASSFLGEAVSLIDRNDITSAKFQLETIIQEYGGTPSSVTASYFLGKLNYQDGDFDNAEFNLRNYFDKSSEGFLKTSTILLLSDIYSSRKEFEKSLKIINTGINKSQSKNEEYSLLIEKARIQLEKGNEKLAKGLLELLFEEEELNVDNKEKAEELFGRLIS